MGNGHNWIWAKLPLVELSKVTAPGGSPSTYICRDRQDCIWTKLPWGRVVLGINDKTLFR